MSQAILKPGTVHREALRIAGEKVYRDRTIEVIYPYTGEVIATVPKATLDDVRNALRIARDYKPTLTPFGGIKDSGLGYKEGVLEAMKSFTNTKTYSLPW